jgi:putative DNA primase/helicase
MSAELDRVLELLTGVNRSGDQFTARCPSHDDARPSLSIGLGDDGKVLIDCHAGCETQEVLQALGLTWTDLFPRRAERTKEQRRVVSEYDYLSANRELLYQAVREEPKKFRVRRPDPAGGWINNINDVERVLYCLPQLLCSDPDDWVFVTEGEKDTDRMRALGLTATSNVFGAGSWRDEYSHSLAARKVTILADNDPAGRRHAQQVAASLFPVAQIVKIVELPGLPDKGDVSDWLEAGRSPSLLHEIAEAAPAWTPKDVPTSGKIEHFENFEHGWESPIPFAGGHRPAFPADALYTWHRDWVLAEASATQTPVDLPAVLTLAGIAAAAAGVFRIRIRPDWVEPLNIYAVIVLPSGERKSAVVTDVVAPIESFERELINRAKPRIAAEAAARRLAEKSLEAAERAATRAAGSDAKELRRVIAEKVAELESMCVPPQPRLLVDDCTPERLVSLLAIHDGRIAGFSAEGDFFDLVAGRYSVNGAANFGAILKAHSGETIRVDRVGRAAEVVEQAALTLGLAVQPAVLLGLAGRPGFRGRGLLARFFYSLPESLLGFREVDPSPMPDEVNVAYAGKIRALLELGEQHDAGAATDVKELRLSSEADRERIALAEDLEPRLRQHGGDLASMSDWAGKYVGLSMRIAGLLHLCKHALNPDPSSQLVSSETIRRARQIAEYALQHARLAFAEMDADPTIEGPKAVLRWLERQVRDAHASGSIFHSFTRRDCHQALRTHFDQAEDVEKALALLQEREYLRERPQPPRTRAGRPPTPTYDLNPNFLSQFTQNPQKAAKLHEGNQGSIDTGYSQVSDGALCQVRDAANDDHRAVKRSDSPQEIECEEGRPPVSLEEPIPLFPEIMLGAKHRLP